MLIRFFNLRFTFVCFFTMLCFNGVAFAEDENTADYAFISLIILSPDFSAANYTVVDDDVDIPVDTDISIIRLPHRFDLSQDADSLLQLEVAIAYQSIKQLVQVGPGDIDNVDTRWDTYAVGLGLLYEYGLTQHLKFTPSLRFGITNTQNRATFNGPNRDILEDELKDELNWKTDAGVLNVGLGLSYNWQLLDRASSAKANIYYAYTESFNESKEAARFSDNAGVLTLKNDMIFPSDFRIYNSRLDFVLLLGINHFFGENRNTLGYATSYQVGAGVELGLTWEQKKYGHIRFSGEVIQAKNLDGWLLSIGYYPE